MPGEDDVYLRLNITEEFLVCMKDVPAAHTIEKLRRTGPAVTREISLSACSSSPARGF
jgi:hypothetical protein